MKIKLLAQNNDAKKLETEGNTGKADDDSLFDIINLVKYEYSSYGTFLIYALSRK